MAVPDGAAAGIASRYLVVEDRNAAPLIDLTRKVALGAFVWGEQPFARELRGVLTLPPLEALVPSGGTVRQAAVLPDHDVAVVAGPGWTAHLVLRRRSNRLDALVMASAPELARQVVEEVRARLRSPKVDLDEVHMLFWFSTQDGAEFESRSIGAPSWTGIRRNYPPSVAAALSALVAFGPPDHSGRLILLHGEPGTGKTTAIRSLVREWRTWASPQLVLDAERFFDRPDYMFRVLLNDQWEREKWKLLLIEDADQFLVSDARQRAGAGLGRLLNLTDGMLGQGTRSLVVITTNEPIGRLHPAIVRPGRCVAKVEFSRFTRPEAVAWLGVDHHLGPNGAPLADLYAIRDDMTRIVEDAPACGAGTYL